MPTKRYFEFSEGSSNKFWEVWCDGTEVFTRYGKIGAAGQLTVKDTRSKDAAKQVHDKLVKEKTGKGYKEQGAKKPNGNAEAVAAPVEIPEGAWRLENRALKSPMFWQIKVDTKGLTITEGEVGTPGKTTKKKFKDEWDAKAAQGRLLAEKKRKGYAYVVPGKSARPAQNAQLEAQIAKDPANDDNLAVYADWLQEQGDVRGELAVLQIQAASRPKDKKLANAVNRLLEEYRGYFFGPLVAYFDPNAAEDDRAIGATWRAGWIDELELGAPSAYGGSTVPVVSDVEELVREIPKVSSARFVRSIVITKPVSDDSFEFGEAVEQLVKAMPSLPALRRLEIGRFSYTDSELSWSHMGPLHKLWPVAKQLEFIKLRAGSMDLGKIILPQAREFLVETGGLARKDLKSIASATWPHLERLSVWFGKDHYGCTCTIDDVQPIFDAKGLGKLEHLGLKNSQFGDAIAKAIPRSKIIRQLETLDLSMSHITTADIEQLLPHKAAFAKLSHLDLSRCLLDAKGQKLAKQLAKSVDIAHQRHDAADFIEDPEYRYAAVGE